MEFVYVPVISNRKTKKYISNIKGYLDTELDVEKIRVMQEDIFNLASITNMNRHMYIKISDLYNKIITTENNEDIFLYKNMVRVFMNEFE